MDLSSLLSDCDDLSDVFEVVKKIVEDTLGQRRAGLMLGLSDLPLYVAGFYVIGSNIIVINENLYNRVLEENSNAINTWSFQVLLHEYLHSLGYRSESEVRRLVREIGGDLERWDAIEFHRNRYIPSRDVYQRRRLSDLRIKLIEGFDRSSTRYIT